MPAIARAGAHTSDVARSSSRVGRRPSTFSDFWLAQPAGEDLAHEILCAQASSTTSGACLAVHRDRGDRQPGRPPYTLAPAWGSAQIAVYRTTDDTLAFRYPRVWDISR